jgi:hypothetical protein
VVLRQFTSIAMPLIFAAAAVSGQATAAQGLWNERAGIGLKPSSSAYDFSWTPGAAGPGPGGIRPWHARQLSDYTLYGGVRSAPRLGLRAAEKYSGVHYAPSHAWSSYVEAGVADSSWLMPRRYSVLGELRTAFSAERGLSLGLRYRVFEPGGATPFGTASDPTHVGWRGYSRALGLGPSYQVQLSYQHSAATTFGLALGRDYDIWMPGLDVPGNGLRQLTFTGQHWLTPSWALSYDVLSHDPGGNQPRLQGLRFGVRYRF